MARRPQVKAWLSEGELLEWTRQATTPAECRRRLAVWITTLHGWPAHEVARLLGVSNQAIWAWMGPYNRLGPEGLDREGRGGRRWAFLSGEQEERLLASMRAEALEGRVMTAKHVYARVCEAAKREVSLGYQAVVELGTGRRDRHPRAGGGPVRPAKPLDSGLLGSYRLDSRLRGNDECRLSPQAATPGPKSSVNKWL